MRRLNHACLGTQHKASGTYDDVHDYFGEAFTQTIVSSVLAQGSTVINVYTPYGGTNWGTIGTSRWCGANHLRMAAAADGRHRLVHCCAHWVGDPDVYTSYDYAACIREYGYPTDRLRLLKIVAQFCAALGPSFAETDGVEPPTFACSQPEVLIRERRSVRDGTRFVFLRHFGSPAQSEFVLVGMGRERTCDCQARIVETRCT